MTPTERAARNAALDEAAEACGYQMQDFPHLFLSEKGAAGQSFSKGKSFGCRQCAVAILALKTVEPNYLVVPVGGLRYAIKEAGIDPAMLVVRSMPFGDLLNDQTREVYGHIANPTLAYAVIDMIKAAQEGIEG